MFEFRCVLPGYDELLSVWHGDQQPAVKVSPDSIDVFQIYDAGLVDTQRGDQLFDEMIFFAALDRDNGFGQIFFYFNIDLQVMHLLTDPILSDVECEAKGACGMLPFLRHKFQREKIWYVSYENKRTVSLVIFVICVRMELPNGSMQKYKRS